MTPTSPEAVKVHDLRRERDVYVRDVGTAERRLWLALDRAQRAGSALLDAEAALQQALDAEREAAP